MLLSALPQCRAKFWPWTRTNAKTENYNSLEIEIPETKTPSRRMGTRLEGSGHFCRSPFLLPNRHTTLSSELNKKKWHYHPMTAWLERPSVAVSRDSLSRHGIPVFRVPFRDRNILQTNTTEQSTLTVRNLLKQPPWERSLSLLWVILATGYKSRSCECVI